MIALLYVHHGWKSGAWGPGGPVAVALFLALSELRPGLLEWPRRAWIKLGDVIAFFTQPVVLGVLYFLLFTPMGLWRRGRGRSPIWRVGKGSEWIANPARMTPERLRKQF